MNDFISQFIKPYKDQPEKSASLEEWRIAKSKEPEDTKVSRADRDLAIKAIRRMLSGTISNLSYDDLLFCDFTDPCIYDFMMTLWGTYDEFEVHPVLLDTEGRQLIAKVILFLNTDLPFENKENPEICPYWPFAAQKDLDDANARPFYLFDDTRQLEIPDSLVTLPEDWESRGDKVRRLDSEFINWRLHPLLAFTVIGFFVFLLIKLFF